jgi:hypothetical protein
MKPIVVLDRNGFLGVPPGTSIKFIMEPETLKSVDRCATAAELERGKLLMATIVDERIDPDAPVFIQARIIDRDQALDDPRHLVAITITVDGLPKALSLSATQAPSAMPRGEVLTVIVTTSDTPAT